MPSRRAIASGLPYPSGACSQATNASPISFWAGTRTLVIQSSARPSSWPESAAVHGRTMFDPIGPYVASSSRRRYRGPGFSVGLQPLSGCQVGNPSMPAPNALAAGATATAAAGPAWPSPTRTTASSRATRAGQWYLTAQ